jgi:hypothetical protein
MTTLYIPDDREDVESPAPIKAATLAEILMQHPDADVYVDYVPHDLGANFSVEFHADSNRMILES